LDRLKAKERTPTETPPRPDSDQQGEASNTELPRFAVTADYATSMVALLFDPEDIPQLAAHPLFQSEARLLHGAATDCELWIEEQIQRDRDKAITGGFR
jgi:hypothetical protein